MEFTEHFSFATEIQEWQKCSDAGEMFNIPIL